jgi:lipoyl(octanoyl) transferase
MDQGMLSLALKGLDPVDWTASLGLVGYADAVRIMEARARRIADGGARELVWLLEHPPLYTAGTSARAGELLEPGRLPVHTTGRGGKITYHGPGQRIAYVMLDLKKRFKGDVRAFVGALEHWIIGALAGLGVEAHSNPKHVGVWVRRGTGASASEAKIAAIGVRVRRGVSFHGVSLNVAPDLGHYRGIVPCGIGDLPVTSLADLGIAVSMKDVDICLEKAFERVIGSARPTRDPVLDAAGEAARL